MFSAFLLSTIPQTNYPFSIHSFTSSGTSSGTSHEKTNTPLSLIVGVITAFFNW